MLRLLGIVDNTTSVSLLGEKRSSCSLRQRTPFLYSAHTDGKQTDNMNVWPITAVRLRGVCYVRELTACNIIFILIVYNVIITIM